MVKRGLEKFFSSIFEHLVWIEDREVDGQERTLAIIKYKFIYSISGLHLPLFRSRAHGGDSIDTTCAVVRDVTAYIAVVRVFRFPSEYYTAVVTQPVHT